MASRLKSNFEHARSKSKYTPAEATGGKAWPSDGRKGGFSNMLWTTVKRIKIILFVLIYYL